MRFHPVRVMVELCFVCYALDRIALKSQLGGLVGWFGAAIRADFRRNGGFCGLGTPRSGGYALGSGCGGCGVLCAVCERRARGICVPVSCLCGDMDRHAVWADAKTSP